MRQAIENGKIVTLECSNPKAGNKEKAIYHIFVVIKSSQLVCGRWMYFVYPVAGKGEFRVSEGRIRG